MGRTANGVYTVSGTDFEVATADGDAFDAGDVQKLAAAVRDHTHIPTRGNLIPTAGLADGAVTDAKVAAANKDGLAATASMRTLGAGAQQAAAGNHSHAGAIQDGSAVGSTAGPTTASTSYVDMTEMSVTLTTTGGDLLCWLSTEWSNSSASMLHTLALALDAAAEPTTSERQEFLASNGSPYMASTQHRFTGVAAGSHTVKGRWKVGAGTGTLTGVRRNLIVLEV